MLLPGEPGCASVPSGASPSACKVFAVTPGGFACLLVRSHACVLWHRCPSCARPSTWVREASLAHSLAGGSRKRRSREFDLKFKSGLLPQYQVRMFCPLLTELHVRAVTRRTQSRCRTPVALAGAIPARPASMAGFDGSLDALLARVGCSWVDGWGGWSTGCRVGPCSALGLHAWGLQMGRAIACARLARKGKRSRASKLQKSNVACSRIFAFACTRP